MTTQSAKVLPSEFFNIPSDPVTFCVPAVLWRSTSFACMSALACLIPYLMLGKLLTTPHTLIPHLRGLRPVHRCAACAYVYVARSQLVDEVHLMGVADQQTASRRILTARGSLSAVCMWTTQSRVDLKDCKLCFLMRLRGS